MSTELECVWICAVKEEPDIEDGSYKVSEVKKFETGRSSFCSASDGDGLGYMEVDNEGGTSSSKNARASDLETRSRPSPFTMVSILFPTTTQQKSFMSSSATGARSQNSSHHFFSANMLSGMLTSNINKAASAPLKKAAERLENLS